MSDGSRWDVYTVITNSLSKLRLDWNDAKKKKNIRPYRILFTKIPSFNVNAPSITSGRETTPSYSTIKKSLK